MEREDLDDLIDAKISTQETGPIDPHDLAEVLVAILDYIDGLAA